MVRRFTSPENSRKILMGNDTDVTETIITKYGEDAYLFFGFLIDDEKEKVYPEKPYVLNKEKFKEHFEKQYGSPMHYISKDDYEWMTKKDQDEN